MCFCFTSNENCHFSSEKRLPPKTGCSFSSGKRHIPNKIMEIVEDFACESMFSFFSLFSIIFLHFLSFSFIFIHLSFIFFHFLSFSFIFFHFLSFSFIFSFSMPLLCAQNLIFLGLNFVTISLDSSYVKNQYLGPSSGGRYPLGPLFLFFLVFFFSRFLSVFLLFIFSFFLIFCSFLHFLIFNVFHFLFSFFPKKKFVLVFFLVFLSNIFYCWR